MLIIPFIYSKRYLYFKIVIQSEVCRDTTDNLILQYWNFIILIRISSSLIPNQYAILTITVTDYMYLYIWQSLNQQKSERDLQAECDLRPIGMSPEQGTILHRLVVVSRAWRSEPYSSLAWVSYVPLATSRPPHTYMTLSTPVAVWKSLYTGCWPCWPKIYCIFQSILKQP